MEMQEYNISENNFEQCIKCTICTVYCPVVPVNPDYPGPKQAGPDGERLRLKKGIFFDETLKYCLNCKRCEVACPSGVRIGDIIQAARIKYGRSKPKLRDMMLASTDLMGSVATKMAPVVNTTLKIKPVKQIMDGVLKIDHRRTFPQYASETFVRWFKKNAEARQEKFSRKVAYFHGCYANYNYPQLGKDFVKVMNAPELFGDALYAVLALAEHRQCIVYFKKVGLVSYLQDLQQYPTYAEIAGSILDRVE